MTSPPASCATSSVSRAASWTTSRRSSATISKASTAEVSSPTAPRAGPRSSPLIAARICFPASSPEAGRRDPLGGAARRASRRPLSRCRRSGSRRDRPPRGVRVDDAPEARGASSLRPSGRSTGGPRASPASLDRGRPVFASSYRPRDRRESRDRSRRAAGEVVATTDTGPRGGPPCPPSSSGRSSATRGRSPGAPETTSSPSRLFACFRGESSCASARRRVRARVSVSPPDARSDARLPRVAASSRGVRRAACCGPFSSSRRRRAHRGGDLERPLPPLPDDEVGRLARSLETMRVTLGASLDEVRQRTRRSRPRRRAHPGASDALRGAQGP